MTAAGRDRTRVLLYGSLWGIALAASTVGDLPLSHLELERVAVFLAAITPNYMVSGSCIAAYGQFAARRLSRGRMLAGALLATPLVLALHIFILHELTFPFFPLHQYLLQADWSLLTHVMSFGWQVVVFGGLVLVACVWAERSARTRGLLAQAQIARGMAATQLGEAQLQALQADIDPAFLQRMLGKVQHTYAVRPADADQLLDQLVAFLRAAMPAVRTGRSTLADELRLAVQVAELHNRLDDGGPRRVVEVVGTPTDDMQFPPLLLLLIDRLAGATPRDAAVRLVAECSEHGVTLALHAAGAGPWLDPALEYRLRVGLGSLYGAQATLHVRERPDAGAVAMTIALPPAPVSNAPPWSAHSTPDSEGGPRWTMPATT